MIKPEDTTFILLPKNKVEGNFEVLWYYIEQALPPMSIPHVLRKGNVLKSLQNGSLQCWIGWYKNGGSNSIGAVATTAVVNDPILGDRSLLVYSLTYDTIITPQAIEKNFEVLKRFAKVAQCSKVIAYSTEESIVKMTEKYLGFKKSYLIETEV